jgi:predicted lysophospholipase L1 biosynthesis ABC-type transport system permease subunit
VEPRDESNGDSNGDLTTHPRNTDQVEPEGRPAPQGDPVMTVRARPNRCIAPSGTPERRPLAPGLAMWLAIFGSLALLGVLRVLGKDGRVWAIALGVLLAACVLVCVWAAAQGRAAERAIDGAVQRMAAARHEREGGDR